MEKTFGIICEGPSDFRIIKRILNVFYKEEEPFISCYQPKQLPSGKSDFGGWSRVLECCSDNTLKEIFEFNNYAVIQIDTDCSPDSPFNVQQIGEEGQIKNHFRLYEDIINKLKSLIVHSEVQKNKHRVLFAICIHSIECWLLPLVYKDNKRENVNNCLAALNRVVQKKNKGMVLLNKQNKNNSAGIKVYDKLISGWKRKVDITNTADHNAGFQKFVESLNELNEENEYTQNN